MRPLTPVALRGDPILKRLPDPAVAVEVGVLTGRLSQYLLKRHKGLNLILVDSWLPSHKQPERYRATGDPAAFRSAVRAKLGRIRAERKIEPFRGRTTILPVSSIEAAKIVPDHSVDLVFLDSDHSLEGVSEDLLAWQTKVKPGGFIGGHDYGNTGTVVGDYSGVKLAVDSWARRRPVEVDTDFCWFVRL